VKHFSILGDKTVQDTASLFWVPFKQNLTMQMTLLFMGNLVFLPHLKPSGQQIHDISPFRIYSKFSTRCFLVQAILQLTIISKRRQGEVNKKAKSNLEVKSILQAVFLIKPCEWSVPSISNRLLRSSYRVQEDEREFKR
jgi:hypothetical protein